MEKTLEPGSLLDGGKYRIVRLLGQGGMGAVFEAEHRDTQKRVAIKCLHPLHAADPAIAERLVREAQATARVRHPNVVDVYDVGQDGQTIYLVMEYLDGEPLTEALLRQDLPVHTAIALLTAAMRGVAAAHRQGVIHRDIKPDNIFLAREAESVLPVPKVLDFGISKLEGCGYQRSLTRSGLAVGTPSYMSYEQISGEGSVDARVDVYAFGVILYELLTGKVPYEANTFSELLVRLSTQTPVPPLELRRDLPAGLSRLVMRTLARERDQRVPSLDVLITQLEPYTRADTFGAGARAIDGGSLAELRETRRPSRSLGKLGWATLGSIVVLAVTALAMAMRPPTRRTVQTTVAPALTTPAPLLPAESHAEPASAPAAEVEALIQPTEVPPPSEARVFKAPQDASARRTPGHPVQRVIPPGKIPRDRGFY